MDLKITTLGGDLVIPVCVPLNATVSGLKELVANQRRIPPRQQRLIHQSSILDNDNILSDLGVKQGACLTLVIMSPFDGFSLTEFNFDGGGDPWYGEWRYPLQLDVSGSEIIACNGLYSPSRTHEKRTFFQNSDGACIYFRDGWRLSETGETDSWCAATDQDSDAPLPAATGWHTPLEDAVSLKVYEEPVSSWDGELDMMLVFLRDGKFTSYTQCTDCRWEKKDGSVRLTWWEDYPEWGRTVYEATLVRGEYWPFFAGRFIEEREGGQAGIFFLNPPDSKRGSAMEFLDHHLWLRRVAPELRHPVQMLPRSAVMPSVAIALDAFVATLLNFGGAGAAVSWEGEWRYPAQVEVSGSESVACDGLFSPAGTHEGRTLYTSGASRLYFEGGRWWLSCGSGPLPARSVETCLACALPPRRAWCRADGSSGLTVVEVPVTWDGGLELPLHFASDGSFASSARCSECSWSLASSTVLLRWRVEYPEWGATLYEAELVRGSYWLFLAGRFLEEAAGRSGVFFLDPPIAALRQAAELTRKLPWLRQASPELAVPEQERPVGVAPTAAALAAAVFAAAPMEGLRLVV